MEARSSFSEAKSQSRSERNDAQTVIFFVRRQAAFLLSYGKKPYSHTMLGYYHTILATVIRFSGTGIRCWVTTIRYSATGIRFSLHRIPVTHGEQDAEGLKGPAERFTRIRCFPGNAVKSGLKAKKVTTPISYQDQGCDVRFIMRSIYFHFFFFRASDQYFDFRISLHQIDDTHDGVNLFSPLPTQTSIPAPSMEAVFFRYP